MGVGAGHAGAPDSNWVSWLTYLNPRTMRYFLNTINQWKPFINARGPAWGTSFSGADVSSQAAFDAAVAQLRGASSSPGSPDIFAWIQLDTSVRWSQFVDTLTQPSVSDITKCTSNPQATLDGLRSVGMPALVVLGPTCANIQLTSTATGSADWWRERWELYRWMYLLGRFSAGSGVQEIELYNVRHNRDEGDDGNTAWPEGIFTLIMNHVCRNRTLTAA